MCFSILLNFETQSCIKTQSTINIFSISGENLKNKASDEKHNIHKNKPHNANQMPLPPGVPAKIA